MHISPTKWPEFEVSLIDPQRIVAKLKFINENKNLAVAIVK